MLYSGSCAQVLYSGSSIRHIICGQWYTSCYVVVGVFPMLCGDSGIRHVVQWQWYTPCCVVVVVFTMLCSGHGIQHILQWQWYTLCHMVLVVVIYTILLTKAVRSSMLYRSSAGDTLIVQWRTLQLLMVLCVIWYSDSDEECIVQ